MNKIAYTLALKAVKSKYLFFTLSPDGQTILSFGLSCYNIFNGLTPSGPPVHMFLLIKTCHDNFKPKFIT